MFLGCGFTIWLTMVKQYDQPRLTMVDHVVEP